MQIHQPIIHRKQKGAIDESTDTWDTIDWLLQNVKIIMAKPVSPAFPIPAGWHWWVPLIRILH